MSSDSSGGVPFEQGGVRGFLHRPDGHLGRGLVLTHGAGGNCNSPVLLAVTALFCDAGVTVLRCDLPFRQKRKSGPPFPAMAAADRAGLREAVDILLAIVPGPIYLGGHSYGGRQASMLAAEQPDVAKALLLLSYPLHPPGKPEQLRTAHFPKLRTPSVFVQGTADPFGSIDELTVATKLIPGRSLIFPIERVGHDLGRGRDFSPAMVGALLET
jgi:predicted alpha/beta-hydrolase family hydrolase